MASLAQGRYAAFLDFLRAQAEQSNRRDPTSEEVRNDIERVVRDRAREYLGLEQAYLNDDTLTVARRAHETAMSDLGLPQGIIADRFADFIYRASRFTAQLLAAQAERDVVAVAKHLSTLAQRVDMKVRSGRHTIMSAVAAVLIDDRTAPTFRYVDRLGRNYKATKHVRDLYRQHLLNVYNEVYLDIMAEYGVTTLEVTHPEPSYKWAGTLVSIDGEGDDPLYYDVRDEIFHPGSDAVLTIPEDA